jgi:HEPN domain-containing protein
MTLKEQLFQELDNASDDIVAQMLKDLRILKSKTPATHSLTSLIGQAQGTFTNPEEADRFIRQERDTWDS